MGSFLMAFEPALFVLHFSTAFFLIVFILLQSGKGTDIGAAFGAGGSQSLFGVRGAATLLSKVTTICAMLFLITSLSLATVSKFTATGSAVHSTVKEHLSEGKTDEENKDKSPDISDEQGIPVE